ncbi:MAG: LysR family transcriptional regulator [Deltaproteobacteria bacterium]|nr:LysR family transcriptional regulator [Deltaproteobacteria bacterium]
MLSVETLPSADELKYFLEVAHTLNLSRAAERLGVTQPALTLAMHRLEETLGQRILIRSKSGVKLSRAGEKLVAQTRLLVHEWEKIKSAVSQDALEIKGHYRLGCHPSVALYTLPSFFPKLLHTHPQLEIQLIHDLSRRITESVISFKIDFGLVVNPVHHPDLVIQELLTDQVSFWVGKNKYPSDMLICDPDLLQSQALLGQLSKFNLNFKRTLTSSNLEVITSLVASGAGVGILPGRVAQQIKSFGLKPFPKKCPYFEDKVCLIYRADAQKSKASQSFVHFIKNHLC